MRLILLAVLALCAAPALAAEDSPPYPVPISGGSGAGQADVGAPAQPAEQPQGIDARMEVIRISRGSDSDVGSVVVAFGYPNERELSAPHDAHVHAWQPYDGTRQLPELDGCRRTAISMHSKHRMYERPQLAMSRAGNGRTRNLYQRGEPVALPTA